MLAAQLCPPLAIPWTIAHQVPLSMEFSYGLPFPSLEDLPNPGIKPGSPELQADSLHLSHQGSPGCNKLQKYSGSKQHVFLILQFWRSEV